MSLKTNIIRAASRAAIKSKKFSPEILVGAGIVGVVATAVFAARATLKVESVVNDHEIETDHLEDYRDEQDEVNYSSAAYERDKIVLKARFGARLAKLYVPTAIAGVTAIACLVGSHRILKGRNLALIAAYKVLDNSFEHYRNRVIKELGEEKELEIRYDVEGHHKKLEEFREDNPETTNSEVVPTGMNPYEVSRYARWFDDSNPEWDKNHEFNLIHLTTVQSRANEQLARKGHLFLNEVYDMLNMPRSSYGQLVGWVYGAEGKDGFVDFGIYSSNNQSKRDFINGIEPFILLDFNVDGVVYDML